jgi:hypothetical protein
LQCILYNIREIGVYADGSDVLHIGEFIVELIHFFGEMHHAFIAVRAVQRGQVDAVEQEFLDFFRIVFRHFLFNQVSHPSLHRSDWCYTLPMRHHTCWIVSYSLP